MNAEDTESPRELARQSEAKRKQGHQSEANVCRRRNATSKKRPLLIAQNTQHKLQSNLTDLQVAKLIEVGQSHKH